MNQKLTISHLAPYLSHGLKGLVNYDHGDTEICTLSIRDGLNNQCSPDSFLNGTYPVKPFLRPLSDLTKEITHKGVSFYPIKEFSNNKKHVLNNSDLFLLIKSEGKCNIDSLPYWIVQKLHEWLFDTSGLIEQGLAIDVNTLDVNPYEK